MADNAAFPRLQQPVSGVYHVRYLLLSTAILVYNLLCIVIGLYKCFDAYSLSGLPLYKLLQYMIAQVVLYNISERKY